MAVSLLFSPCPSRAAFLSGVDDYAALKAILPLKPDMVALSFVQTPQDILDLHKVLVRTRADTDSAR